jgi:hypothetical protein
MVVFFALVVRAYAESVPEFMVFGPYVSLGPGKYRATFRLKVRDNKQSKSVVGLSVVAQDAARLFATRDVKGTDFRSSRGYQGFDVEFTTTGEKDFEFRVRYLGNTELFVDKVALSQLEKWSQQEAVAGNLIMGSSGSNKSTQQESFMGAAEFVEIEAENPIFKYNLGKPVIDSDASGKKAVVGEVAKMISSPGTVSREFKPLKIGISDIRFPKMKLQLSPQFFVGYAVGTLLTVIFIFYGLKFTAVGAVRSRGKHRKKSDPFVVDGKTLSNGVKYSASRLSNKRMLASLLLITVVVSIFFESVSIFRFVVRTEYLFFFLFVFLVFKIGSRFFVGTGLALLASTPLFLTYGYKQLAEKVGIYVLYFLVAGIILQIIEYVKESSWAEEPLTAGVQEKSPKIPDSANESAQGDEISPRQKVLVVRKWTSGRRQDSGKISHPIASAAFAFAVGGAAFWVVLSQSGSGGSKVLEYLGVSGQKIPKISGSEISIEDVPKRNAEVKGESVEKAVAETGAVDIGKVKLEILNGNGIGKEAARVGLMFQVHGFNVFRTGNAGRFDYDRTIVRHRRGHRNLAELVAKELAGSYVISPSSSTLFKEDLPPDSAADVVLILGRDIIRQERGTAGARYRRQI